MHPTTAAPLPWATLRPIAVRLVFAAAVLTQLYFVVRGYSDPHKHFAFQPFNESSAWRADLFRVTPQGRQSIREGWEGYRWEELVRERGLQFPYDFHHADSGIGSVLLFFQSALDWVADHTPRDRNTIYLEAEVTWHRNRRGPFSRTLRSHRRATVP